mgnify:CR=1 FL=1
MKWSVEYSAQAIKFAEQHELHDSIKNELKKLLLKMQGEIVNIDIKRLKGEWEGYLRLRKGKIRIIFSIDNNNKIIFIDKIDFRGNAYKV